MPEQYITLNDSSCYIVTSNSSSALTWDARRIGYSSTSSSGSWNYNGTGTVNTGQWLSVNENLYFFVDRRSTLEGRVAHEKAWIGRMAYAARERRRKAADAVAMSLLEELFGHEIESEGSYLRVGSKSYPGRDYRICTKGGMVEVWQDGKKDHSLCAHPSSKFECPGADTAIAQRILLEVDEDAFLKLANRHPLY